MASGSKTNGTALLTSGFLRFWKEVGSPDPKQFADVAVRNHAEFLSGRRPQQESEPELLLVKTLINGTRLNTQKHLLEEFDALPEAFDCAREEFVALIDGLFEAVVTHERLVSEARSSKGGMRGEIKNVDRPHGRTPSGKKRKHADPKLGWKIK